MPSDVVFRRTLGYKQHCDLCGKTTHSVYQVNHDGHLLTFDSPDHARIGLKNWEEKKAKGIKPGIPYKEEDLNVLPDNTDEM